MWMAIAAAGLVTLTAGQAARGAVARERPDFCQTTTVRNFLAPLERMPKRPSPGPKGRLGFGPPRIELHHYAPLIAGEGRVGYALSLAAAGPPAHPRWNVTAMLWRVNRRGQLIEPLTLSLRRVRSVSMTRGIDLSFVVSSQPAFYLVSATFRTPSGRKLGSFGSYYRVVRPFHNTRLALDAERYRAGETVLARVENFGTLTARYGVDYGIERFEAGTWIEAPESPEGPWKRPLPSSAPGHTGPCFIFRIPDSTPPGRYRFVKPIVSQRAATAEFNVLP